VFGVCVRVYFYDCVFLCITESMYVCVCAHICVHMRVRVHVFVHLYMRLCVRVCHGERDKVSVFACVRAYALKEDC